MKKRCYEPKTNSYHSYGGKGIRVCDRWKDSFINFVEDMGIRPDGYTLDRIDNSKDYCKENCKWSTRKEQTRNTSQNVFIKYKGERFCIADWAEKLNIPSSIIRARLKKGLSTKEVLAK